MNIDKVNLNYILNLKVEDLIENTKNFYSKFNVVYDSSIDKQDYITVNENYFRIKWWSNNKSS